MTLSGWYNTTSRRGRINVHIVNTTSNPLSKTYIRYALTEQSATFAYEQAMRKFFSNGADTLQMQGGDTVTIAGNATLDRGVNFWVRPSWNADSCRMVAFIQKDTVVNTYDKPVYQSSKIWVRSLPQTGVETAPIVEPPITEVWLSAAEPTPFKATARINYALPSDGPVSLAVYNLVGAKVRTLLEGRGTPGHHTAVWDGCNDRGTRVPQGVYFFELKTAYKNLTTRTVLVR